VNRRGKAIRVLHGICVLLIAVSGFVQAAHIHPENSKVSSHECTICSVAHAGVLSGSVYRPVPLFGRTVLVEASEAARYSSGFVFALRIRPPPSV